jgi:hypothetical protein
MVAKYHRDGCGNLTFPIDDTPDGVPLSELIEIAEKELPQPEGAVGTAKVVVSACEENGHVVLVMTFHHCE